MSQQTPATTPGTSGRTTSGSSGSALVTPRGTTTVADRVVTTIAGLALREVPGVHAVGGGAARATGALRDRITGGGGDEGRGVTAEVTDGSVALGVRLVARYGVPLADLTAAVRRDVSTAVARLTGLTVSRVDVTVDDVHLDGLDDDADDGSAAAVHATGR